MDASLSRASIPERNDPHDWNTWDHYRNIHERRISEHPFIDPSTPNTLKFLETGYEGVLSLQGRVYCFRSVALEVEQWYESQYFGHLRKVRCYSYRYAPTVMPPGSRADIGYSATTTFTGMMLNTITGFSTR